MSQGGHPSRNSPPLTTCSPTARIFALATAEAQQPLAHSMAPGPQGNTICFVWEGDKAAPPTGLTPRMHRSSNTIFSPRAHLPPHKVPLGHKPLTQRAMKGPGDKIRPPNVQKPKPARKFLACLPRRQLAGIELPVEPWPGKCYSPARQRCPGDSHT